MKRKRWIIIIGGVILLGVIAIASSNGKLPRIRTVRYRTPLWGKKFSINVTTKLKEPEQKEVMVYEVVCPKVDAEYVRKLAEKYKMKNVRNLDKDGFLGNDWMIMMEPDGNFRLERTPRPKIWKWERTDPHPTEEEVKEVARQFMSEHKELFTGQEWIVKPKLGGEQVGFAGDQHYTFYCVGYSRKIDGLRTWGGGIRLVFDIWKDLKVGRMYMTSPDLKPLKKYPIKSVKQALADLGKGAEENCDVEPIKDTFNIESVKVVYYLRELKAHQRYMQPCYLFTGKDADGEKVQAAVQAIKDEHIDKTKLDPPK